VNNQPELSVSDAKMLSATLEDRDHLWTCPAISRQQWRKDCQSNMLQALKTLDTAPPIQSLLLDALDALLHGKQLEAIRIDPSVEDVAGAQALVGWHQILKGRFVCEWKQAQERYYRGTIRSTQTNDASDHEVNASQSIEGHQPDSDDYVVGVDATHDEMADSENSCSSHEPPIPDTRAQELYSTSHTLDAHRYIPSTQPSGITPAFTVTKFDTNSLSTSH